MLSPGLYVDLAAWNYTSFNVCARAKPNVGASTKGYRNEIEPETLP